MRFMWRAHKLIWRLTGGRLGRKVGGMPVLELTTTGRTSGKPRMILISYVADPAGPVIAGTNAGVDYDPAWVKNLRANPTARMRLDGTVSAVDAKFLEGPAHEAAWSRFLEADTAYGEYAKHLTRPVPLVQLVPTD
jgi:F420H(2)-dependent quinone reductase